MPVETPHDEGPPAGFRAESRSVYGDFLCDYVLCPLCKHCVLISIILLCKKKVRRTQFASPDLWKMAMKQPQGIKAKKKKNQTTNIFGETIGRLHLERQDIDNRSGKKSKALRLAEKIEKAEESAAIESELGREQEEMTDEFKQAYGFAPDM